MYSKDGKTYPTVTDTGIYGFFQEYRYLSNFHLCTIKYDGYIYPSSEHCYMAQKTNDYKEKYRLSVHGGLTVSQAKQFGQTVKLIDDWDNKRLPIMQEVVLQKFKQNKDIARKLLTTGNKYLEETNYWRDKFWGSHVPAKHERNYNLINDGEVYGKNNLGKILMKVRRELWFNSKGLFS